MEKLSPFFSYIVAFIIKLEFPCSLTLCIAYFRNGAAFSMSEELIVVKFAT